MTIKKPYIAGLAAGFVVTILYLSLATGSGIGKLLFMLAPLPALIAGFGWGFGAALTAGMTATILIMFALGPTSAMVLFLSIAVPAMLLAHYAFLYRTYDIELEGESEPTTITDWYPVGNIVLLICLYSATIFLLSLLASGASYQVYLKETGAQIDLVVELLTKNKMLKDLPAEKMEQHKELLQAILPASSAIIWSLFTLINVWLAGRITHMSGLLSRPWPDLADIRYPRLALYILPVLFVASYMFSELGALIISSYMGAMLLAFLLLGLAVIHYISRGSPLRNIILVTTYVATIFVGWGALALIALGIIEPLMRFRDRKKNRDNNT